MLEKLKERVCEQNLQLVKYGLVVLTWGNVSALSEDGKYVVIKPSGVSYDNMKAGDMVVTDRMGNIVEGDLRPSTDLATHLALYDAFPASAARCTPIRATPSPRRRRGWISPVTARPTPTTSTAPSPVPGSLRRRRSRKPTSATPASSSPRRSALGASIRWQFRRCS